MKGNSFRKAIASMYAVLYGNSFGKQNLPLNSNAHTYRSGPGRIGTNNGFKNNRRAELKRSARRAAK